MFGENPDFYPTPEKLIKKMLAPYKTDYKNRYGETWYDLSSKVILEPSAGKGDIAKFIEDHTHRDSRIYCIESDNDLRATLQGKDFKLIHHDFLTYEGDILFDLIVMNPPFSNGDKHLLKAWEVLKDGEIVCLLNAETIRNVNSRTRELLTKIIQDNGSVEFVQGAFKDAQRKTGVEVAIVRLKKEDESMRFNFFSSINREKEFDVSEDTLNNAPARIDVIGNMVTQYENSKEAFVEYMRAKAKLEFYLSPLESEYSKVDIDKCIKSDSNRANFNKYLQEVKKVAWTSLLNKTKFSEVMTARVKDDFRAYMHEQGVMDFTAENIANMFNTLLMNKGMILDRCLVDVFDRMCSYDKKNRVHWEGWKTNDAYKVNERVIMPYFVEYSFRAFKLKYDRGCTLDDIDKVMGMIKGKKLADVYTIEQALKKKFDDLTRADYSTSNNYCESEFFEIRFFLKGTIHLKFKDRFIHQEFNMRAAKDKAWLPDTK